MPRHSLTALAVALAVTLVFSGAAYGQAVYGSILGTVTDSTGAAVPNARITITDTGKGVTYTTTTNESGNYSQTHLIVGVYEVRAEAPGFDTYVQKNVSVEVDASVQVNPQLHVGQIGETVNVSAEAPLLRTEKAETSDTMTQKQMQELPVFSRDMSRIYFAVPGVQATGTTAASEQPQDIYRPTIGGQYWGGISFQLDGTDNRESVLGEPVITPNLEAVSELKITTTAYDAEFGEASQAIISAQTKSGTNQLHGSGFWFRRDQRGAARDPFAQAQPIVGTNGLFIPPTLWNQFGGAIGGPIQKDKTFFFGDYQGTGQKNSGSQLLRVPTAAERMGDLSDLPTPFWNPCLGSNCNVAPAQRQQFAGNMIPLDQLSPQAEALLKFIPLPNIAGVSGAVPNYTASGTGVVNWNGFDVRVDRYQTEKLHMFGRFSFLQVGQTNPGAFGFEAGGPNFATMAFAGAASLRNQSLSYGIDYVIRPNWLADFRFGFFRYRVFVNPNGVGTSPAKDAGIPGLNLDNNYTSGMPYINLGTGTGAFRMGYSLGTNSCNCPLNEQENEFQWVGNITHTFSNHTLKFGADFRYAQNLRVPSDSHRAGELTFDATTTQGPNGGGLPLASFLLGQVNSFQRYISNSTDAAERQHRLFSYVQDTWRITPKLSLNFGLRWEIYFPQYVTGKDEGAVQSIATGEVLIAGENGINLSGNIKTDFKHFAPRAGIAYQIRPDTVIRTGYGRSYDVGVFGVSFGHNVTQNVPVLANQSLNPANPWLSVFTLASGPPALDPTTILAPQPKGPTGNPILPNLISPNVLPINSNGTMRLPTVDAWNFTIEHTFSPSTVLSVAYVGNHGYHVTAGGTNYNINQPTIVGFGTLSTNQRRPFFQKFGWTQTIKYFADDSTVKFNSLQVRGEKRFSGGLTFQGNFTWASAFDFANDYYFWNHDIDYGRESNIRRFVFNFSHVYELPFGKGHRFLGSSSRPVDLLVGGWQLAGVWTWQSGYPFTPSYLDCGRDNDTGPCRANLVGNASVSDPDQHQWFATAPAGTSGPGCTTTSTATAELNANGCTRGPWSRPAAGTFGNVARNSFFGPHYFNADASMSKAFHISERVNAQFRAELFNAFNHVNLGQPNATVDSPTAGQIFALAGLSGMRKWQFGVRVNF